MRILGLVLGLIFPACASGGADGLPTPAPIDFAALVRPAAPNTALAAPAGFQPAPDVETHPYAVTPDQLYTAVRTVAAGQPRTFRQVHYDDRRQAHYVVRSAVWNFPDLVAVQVQADSTLIIWSRSVYGRSDLGVNKARVGAWLAALDRTLAAHE